MKYVITFIMLAICGHAAHAQPHTVADTAYVTIGIPDTIDVTANDVGAYDVWMATDSPRHGTVYIYGGMFIYIANSSYAGIDSFEYIACEVEMSTCDSSMVYLLPDSLPATYIEAGASKPVPEYHHSTDILGRLVPRETYGIRVDWYTDGKEWFYKKEMSYEKD